MCLEADTSVEQRILVVFGKVSPQTFTLVKTGLPAFISETSRVLFVDFSPADYPIGKIFTRVFKPEAATAVEIVECKIVAVTQQWAKPLDEIPHGWKTICVIEFTPAVPALIQSLSEIEHWYDERKDCVYLSNDETWSALVNVEI